LKEEKSLVSDLLPKYGNTEAAHVPQRAAGILPAEEVPLCRQDVGFNPEFKTAPRAFGKFFFL
jgi:hypothetical protein